MITTPRKPEPPLHVIPDRPAMPPTVPVTPDRVSPLVDPIEPDDGLPPSPTPTVASVDNLIDENGSPIPVPEEAAEVRLAHEVEDAVASTSPANWSRIGLIVLAAIIAVLLLLQVLGGRPGTDVRPGTPTAAPEEPAPVAPVTPAV